jgi:ATP synthase protein I
MYKTIALQLVTILIVAALVAFWLGERGAISAVLGGAVVVFPNTLFALRVWVAARSNRISAAGFLIGEFIKVVATLTLLVTVAMMYRDVHWLALLAGLIVALKSNLFGLLIKN